MDPSKTGSDIAAMGNTWSLLRAIMGGTEEMRNARETYLPKYDGESDSTYENRLRRSVLTNYLEDAVRNAVSLPFRRDIQIGDSIPEDVSSLFRNIDLMGNDINQFSRNLLEDGALMGYGFILVDFSKNETDGTIAGENAANLRPYFVFVKADDVLGIYTQIDGANEIVTHFRYRETDVVLNDEYEEEIRERVRVYKPGEYEVWEKVQGEWKVVDGGPMTITTHVPVVPVWCGRRVRGFQVRPLFLDLAYKQVEHWQSASDQRNILSFSRFPMLAVSGAGKAAESEIVIGPSRVLATESTDGRWYYVEPDGHAIESGRRDLEDLKEEMRILGLQPLVSRVGNITATARALDETRVHSAVQVLAMNLEDALRRATSMIEQWLGREPQEEYDITVNRDFGLSIRDTAEVDSLIRSRITGEMSRYTFWSELKRRAVLSPDFDPAAEQARLDQEFAAGQIPFTVSAKLPSLPTDDAEKDLSGDMNITNTFAEIQGARNKAFKQGRAPVGSTGIESPSKNANTLIGDR